MGGFLFPITLVLWGKMQQQAHRIWDNVQKCNFFLSSCSYLLELLNSA